MAASATLTPAAVSFPHPLPRGTHIPDAPKEEL